MKRWEMKVKFRFGIVMGAGPKSLDIVLLKFGSHQ
jgi:hypothetical protein